MVGVAVWVFANRVLLVPLTGGGGRMKTSAATTVEAGRAAMASANAWTLKEDVEDHHEMVCICNTHSVTGNIVWWNLYIHAWLLNPLHGC